MNFALIISRLLASWKGRIILLVLVSMLTSVSVLALQGGVKFNNLTNNSGGISFNIPNSKPNQGSKIFNSPPHTGNPTLSPSSSPSASVNPSRQPESTPTLIPPSSPLGSLLGNVGLGSIPTPLPSSNPAPTLLPVPTVVPTSTPTLTPGPTLPPTPGCSGPPLTSQSQVQPNTSYCGGHATSRIVLASGDSWTNGEVSGVTSGRQQGAVTCGNPCWLTNMNIHDNPNAFAGIYSPWFPSSQAAEAGGPMVITGGHVSRNGSIGIGGGDIGKLTINGVEIDHNGSSANCGFEGGGFKGVNHGALIANSYFHDNNCAGIWFDIDAANNVISNNRVFNNSGSGIFYEISHDAKIFGNDVEGNGYDSGCGWLWNGGITAASSYNVEVYNNTLSNNCNGITGTQQNRGGQRNLQNYNVHDNNISGSGKSGVVEDNGADLTTRNITFTNNQYLNGQNYCGFHC